MASQGQSFRIFGPLRGESIGHRWITLIKVLLCGFVQGIHRSPMQSYDDSILVAWGGCCFVGDLRRHDVNVTSLWWKSSISCALLQKNEAKSLEN